MDPGIRTWYQSSNKPTTSAENDAGSTTTAKTVTHLNLETNELSLLPFVMCAISANKACEH